ncbi:MAG: TonB-dependent receptor [Alphaproteobacteria bacterium]|nr:TonB-dependent receptor [Alphaproteobacteria bacterium]
MYRNRHNLPILLNNLCLLCLFVITIFPYPQNSAAQETTPISAPIYAPIYTGQPIDEIVITASRTLQRSALKTPSPVDILTADAITNTAHSEAGRAIQALAPAFNFPSTSIADGTDSLKPATLRGLNPDQTLVLFNGTRRHKSALLHVNTSVGRGTAGTDMNALAPSFIENVEILRDGASAQYGSDAIAGVINIKLRETSPGEMLISYGQTTENDGETTRFAANKGFELPQDGFLFVGYEYRNREKTNRSGLSGTVLYAGEAGSSDIERCHANDNSGCDPREFTANRHNFIVGDPQSEHHTALLNMGVTWGDIDVSGFLSWSARDNQSTGFFREPDDPTRNIVAIYPDGFLPQINTDIDDLSGQLKLAGQYAGWDMDINYTQGRNEFDFYITNSLNASFGANSPRETDAGGMAYEEKLLNFNMSRQIGLFSVAAGAEWKNENFEIRAGAPLSYLNCNTDANAETLTGISGCVRGKTGGIQVFPGFRPSNALSRERDSLAVYTEIAREFGALLANTALRWEDYDGFGNILVAKLSLFYQLNDAHALRATFNNGFRAPSMHQLYFNTVGTAFVAGVLQQTGTFANDSTLARALGIPSLKEETSNNISLGYVFTPKDNFALTIDGYQIDIDDRIILSGQVSNQNPLLSANALAILAAQEASSAQFLINAASTKTQGVEMVATWQPPIKRGRLDTKLAFHFTQTDIEGEFGAPGLLQGLENDLFSQRDRSIIESWQPESRVTLSADYQFGGVVFSTSVNRYGSYIGSENITTGYVEQKFDEAYIVDLRVQWQPHNGLTLTLFGDNIFDHYPEQNRIDNSRGGKIKDIVDSFSVFSYSRRTAPYGFNGAYWGVQLKQRF